MACERGVLGIVLPLALMACGADDGSADRPGTTEAGTSSGASTAFESSSASATATSSVTEGTESTQTSATESGRGSDSEAEGTTSGGGPLPEIPVPDGPCPTFATGDLEFQPAETGVRRARVYVEPAAGGGGPLVFWFHGTGQTPQSSQDALSQEDLEAIVAMGGMVVMPFRDPAAGDFPWFLFTSEREDDLHLMDEIVGCAAEGPGIDPRHVHAAGFSAGGVHVSEALFRRASYVASVVPFSGGLFAEAPPSDAPGRFVAAMAMHGGPTDDVLGFDFEDSSASFRGAVEERGGYALVCDHGEGHVLPADRALAWDFMQAHPFGGGPSVFQTEGVPSWVPPFCDP